ncbi:MAG: beta-phosphoglucomutase [Lentisphaerae bacterium]|nr:beta-phosphoglucomutase [Lentisphaerota bacterium]
MSRVPADQEAPGADDAAEHGLRGVVFDLDGVLVTTDDFHYRAWKSLADELGLVFDREINHQLRGISREDSLRAIYRNNPGTPLPDGAAFREQCERKNGRYVALLQRMTENDVLPGARELLDALRQAGIRVAVASASKNAPTVLERTGLHAFIDAWVSGACVTRSKPDPEVFLLSAARLKLPPACCLGVEDAESGIQAIHAAGMAAVAIGAQAAGGDLTVQGVAELTPALLRETWRAHAARPPAAEAAARDAGG